MTDEKDLVERCAEEIQEQFNAVSAAGARLFAETVLEAAGVERLRTERDEALRLARDIAKDLEQRQAHSAALTSKLEGEKRLSGLLRERIAKLEKEARECLLEKP